MLHTVPALAPSLESRFRTEVELRRGALPAGIEVLHLVDGSLLAKAIAKEDTQPDVTSALRALQQLGADAVLVTCSSIGEEAEVAASELDVALTRIDTGMALQVNKAEAAHPRVVVLATLESTVGPSARLMIRIAPDAQVEPVVCGGAAEARSKGDQEAHDRIIADEIRKSAGADVIVLAQASMADAAAQAGVDTPVLTSTDLGIKWFVQELERQVLPERGVPLQERGEEQ